MPRPCLALRWAGLGLAISASASAQGPESWLLQAGDAARTVNYQGIVIYRGEDVLETFRVVHRFEDGEERERMQSLTGEVREVLKHDDRVICILPRDQHMTVNLPTPQGFVPLLPAARLQQVQQLYEFKDLGTARIAGRVSHGVAVEPRDRYRYGYDVWADAETAVPLRVTLRDADRQMVEQIFFTQVEFPSSIPDAAFETAFEAETMRRVTQAAAPAISAAAAEVVANESAPFDDGRAGDARALLRPDAAELQVSALPPGFRVVMRDVRKVAGRGLVEHVVLSDGLTAVSVFRAERRVSQTMAARGVSRLGAVHAYSRVDGRMDITVVGEVPPATIRMIGDSFQLPVGDALSDGATTVQ